MAGSTESRSNPPTTARGRIPDFFIVGHPKCGTTALYEMLRGHPQLHMPVKEPWFFAPDRRRLDRQRKLAEDRTLEEYTALFAGALPNQLIGESSTAYMMSELAAASISELQPGARIIALLREPASFLRSLHFQSVQDRLEDETSFGKAIARGRAERVEPLDHADSGPQLVYENHIRYVEQLRRYHDVFPSDQVLVLIYDDFRRDNEATVRRVLRFLDVDDTVPIHAAEANPTVRLRSRKLDDVVRSVYLGSGPVAAPAKAALKAIAPGRMRKRALRAVRRQFIYGKPAPADEALMLELRRRFKPEVVAASEYLNRDLVTLWGYDRID
jgi:hypothetical protein